MIGNLIQKKNKNIFQFHSTIFRYTCSYLKRTWIKINYWIAQIVEPWKVFDIYTKNIHLIIKYSRRSVRWVFCFNFRTFPLKINMYPEFSIELQLLKWKAMKLHLVIKKLVYIKRLKWKRKWIESTKKCFMTFYKNEKEKNVF